MTPLAEMTLEGWIRALARETPTPAGGALALATLAGAAALCAKVAGLAGRPPGRLEGLAIAFLEGAERDGALYLAAVRGGNAEEAACLRAGGEDLERALDLLDEIGGLFAGLATSLAADVAAAERMSRAAARTLLVNLAVNLSEWSGSLPGSGRFAATLETLRGRLDRA